MMTTHRLTLHASLQDMARLSDLWDQLAEQGVLPSKTRWEVQLAAEEAAANVIRHGYREQPDKTFDVEIRLSPTDVEVTVEDSAPAFDPLQVPPPRTDLPLEERTPGGMGIFLVRKSMDRVSYERVDGKNRLIMSKHFDQAQGNSDGDAR
jgi:serine/threonine-protein kinase RsbW